MAELCTRLRVPMLDDAGIGSGEQSPVRLEVDRSLRERRAQRAHGLLRAQRVGVVDHDPPVVGPDCDPVAFSVEFQSPAHRSAQVGFVVK